MTSKLEILRLYRSLLHHTRLLPPQPNTQNPKQQVKDLFRQHKSETDVGTIEKLVHNAQQRLAFIRMILPRHQQQKLTETAEKRTYLFHEGKVVERDRVVTRGCGRTVMRDQGVDPLALERHQRLLERQHFRGDFWRGKPKS